MQQDSNNSEQTDPINKNQDVQKSEDERIDQDFEGYPGNPSKENIIRPKDETDRTTADVDNANINDYADSSENKRTGKNREDIDELQSDGSGGAFKGTEEVSDETEADDVKKEDKNNNEAY